MSKNRIKVPAVVIRTRAEMEAITGQIAALKIQEQQITADMDEQISTVRARFAPALALCWDQIGTGMEAARAWAEANPAEFGKGKSIVLTQAVIGYRTGQPQLKTLKGWTWDRVLEYLRAYPGLRGFIRVKEEVDKAQILATRDNLLDSDLTQMGVRVVQEESFYVEPKLTDVETRETVEA